MNAAVPRAAHARQPETPGYADELLNTARLIASVNQRLHELIKVELHAKGYQDINGVQGMLIYSIGDKEVSAGDLRLRRYYMGANASYNLKKLVEAGLIENKRSKQDARAVRLSLTAKGLTISKIVGEFFAGLARDHEMTVTVPTDELSSLNATLRRFDRRLLDALSVC